MMFKGLRFRPAGWLAAIGTLGAMAATMVIAAPGGAATPEKEFTASFKQECVIGPGSLNQKGTLEVMTRSKGPETVIPGQVFEPHESTSTITSPAELGNTLFSLGVRKVKGSVTNFELNGIGLSPAVLNIAKPAAFPNGLPYEAPVEQNKATSFTVPHEGTYSFGPYTVTGAAGSNAELEVNGEPGFTETGTGEFTATGKGIVSTLEGVNEAGGHVIGPLPVVCTAPKGIILSTLPIGGTGTTTTCPNPPEIKAIEPNSGSAAGGTPVQITGCGFEEVKEVVFAVGSTLEQATFTPQFSTSIAATAPRMGPPFPLPSTAQVYVVTARGPSNRVDFTYVEPTTTTSTSAPPEVTFDNWKLTGSLTVKKLDQTINLPAGCTFNGKATVPGPVEGNTHCPPFTASVKILGLVPTTLGLELVQVQPVKGTITPAGGGNLLFKATTSDNINITSVAILGLTIPTSCMTAEPILFPLETTAPSSALATGATFNGEVTLPKVKCGGGFLGVVFGGVLTQLMSGPNNPFTFTIAP
jgi:hypothetical protein